MPVTARQFRMGQLPDEYGLTEFGQTLTDAFAAYAQYETAQKCLDLNLARAEQGLSPIDCASYGTGVQIGMAPSTQNTLLIVVAVLAGVYLLPKLLR